MDGDFGMIGGGYFRGFCLCCIGESEVVVVDDGSVAEVDVEVVVDVECMVGFGLYCLFDWFFELVLVL